MESWSRESIGSKGLITFSCLGSSLERRVAEVKIQTMLSLSAIHYHHYFRSPIVDCLSYTYLATMPIDTFQKRKLDVKDEGNTCWPFNPERAESRQK